VLPLGMQRSPDSGPVTSGADTELVIEQDDSPVVSDRQVSWSTESGWID
jgi:hypothetical protein